MALDERLVERKLAVLQNISQVKKEISSTKNNLETYEQRLKDYQDEATIIDKMMVEFGLFKK